MMFSSLPVASRTVAILSVSPLLLCALGSTATSQTATPSANPATSLPGVLIEAPKQVVRPQKRQHRAIARNTVSPETSRTAPTPLESRLSPEQRLARLPNAITGSCVDGCVSSLPSGGRPWIGCNASASSYSSTCRNVGHYKTYNECTTAGLAIGWRNNEVMGYCTSLAFKS